MFTLIRQEFLRHLRGKRLFIWLACFSAAACLVIGVMWPTYHGRTLEIALASQSMVEVLAGLLAAAAVLIVPAYGAATIALERERETYDQLRLSLIPVPFVVLGKFLSILAVFATLVIALLPILASTYFLLGMDVDAVGRLVVMAFMTAFSGAAIGMLCSVALRRMPLAQTVAFLLIFLVMGSTGSLFTVAGSPLASYFSQSVLYGFAPIRVLQAVVAGFVNSNEMTIYLIVHGVVGVGALMIACLFMTYETAIDSFSEPSLPQVTLRKRTRGRARPRISRWVNPVAARETRWGELMMWRWQLRLFIVSTFIQVLGWAAMTASLSPGIPPHAEMWIALRMCLALFLVPGMTASTIIQERARKSLDFLLMTRMRPSTIFLGKVMGVIASTGGVLLPCVISIAVAPLLYPSLGLREFAVLVTGLISLVVWMFVCACASTYACAVMVRPTAAFAGSYILCALLFGGFGSGLFALKFYGTGTAFLSPVLGFLEKAADAGSDPLDQFSGPWVWHVITHLALGMLFILLALREVEPFAQGRRQRWQ